MYTTAIVRQIQTVSILNFLLLRIRISVPLVNESPKPEAFISTATISSWRRKAYTGMQPQQYPMGTMGHTIGYCWKHRSAFLCYYSNLPVHSCMYSGCRRSARIAKAACLSRVRSVDGSAGDVLSLLRGHGGFSRAATTYLVCVFQFCRWAIIHTYTALYSIMMGRILW